MNVIDKVMLAELDQYSLELFVNGRFIGDCLTATSLYGERRYVSFTMACAKSEIIEDHVQFLQTRDRSGISLVFRARRVADGTALPYMGAVGILKVPEIYRSILTGLIQDDQEITCNVVLYMDPRHFGDQEDVAEIDKTLRELVLMECPLAQMFDESKGW